MTQPIHLIAEIYAVEVPDDARKFRFGKSERLKGKLFYNTTLDYFAASQVIDLPPGNWQLICTTKETTPERLAEIFGHAFIGDDYARQTLKAMLTSKNLDPNKNYILIKKL